MVAMLGVLLLLMLSGLAVLGARAMATAGWLAAVMG